MKMSPPILYVAVAIGFVVLIYQAPHRLERPESAAHRCVYELWPSASNG